MTVLLAETNWSNRQIAAVAGVSPDTVDRVSVASNEATRPAVLGADNKTYPKRAPRTVTATVIDDEPAGRCPNLWPRVGESRVGYQRRLKAARNRRRVVVPIEERLRARSTLAADAAVVRELVDTTGATLGSGAFA